MPGQIESLINKAKILDSLKEKARRIRVSKLIRRKTCSP